MRILLYTGKGGAGKTTIAAATAVRCAETERRTLVVGSDTSQSLADCLNSPLSDEPLEIARNLWAQEVDPLVRLERMWPELEPVLSAGFGHEIGGAAVEELTLGPGMGDLIRLLALKEHCDRSEFDVIVVDLGSSLTALQLLAYPEGAAWWVDRLAGDREPASPLPRLVEQVTQNLADLRARLTNGDECSVRIVTTAEQLALRETQRSLTFTNLYGYNVDSLILNRQKRAPRAVADMFGSWPIQCLTLFDRDIIGFNLLSEMGFALFTPPADPAAVLHEGRAQQLARGTDGYVLSLRLPFVHEDDIDLLQHHGQLILQIGRIRRVIQLPSPIDQLSAADAVLEDGTLEIHFR
ncbi:MAG: ArsA family ATPase [Chloroflexi bacterium]|nr:ArsA family ATPase [Chloroflexota bacterium]